MACAPWPILVSLALLTRPACANPPFDPDPSCRAVDGLARVQTIRATVQRQASSERRLGIASAQTRPSLAAEWDSVAGALALKMRGQAGDAYQWLTASSVNGPWELAMGFLLAGPEARWIVPSPEKAGFYRISTATPLETEPLASNFRLIDLTGRSRELYYHTDWRGIAVIAAGERLDALAPFVADLNALHAGTPWHRVLIWVVLSDASTPRQELQAQAQALGLQAPVLLDRDLLASYLLGIEHVSEAALVRAPDFVTVYRGAVRQGGDFYLKDAIQALKTGRRPAVWRTRLPSPPLPSLDGAQLNYSRAIAPILRTYCVRCHRPNTAAPFAFSSYSEVQSRVLAIRHQVASGNMPPWQADPEYGQFTNSLALPSDAKRKLIAWLDAGGPRDAAPDPLTEAPPDTPGNDLQAELGPPDAVMTLPVQSIRATGAEPYRTFQVPTPNTTNAWLRAASLAPGNSAVVHHYTVYQPLPSDLVGEVNLGFAFYVPGRGARAYPEGTGMFLPQRGTLLFELHYNPNGRPALDEPSLSLWFHREPPARHFRVFTIVNSQFEIPPGEPEHRVTAQHRFDQAVTVHSLACHMHLRGRSMVIDVIDPQGSRERLLSVPNYNFHWQTRYELAQPKAITPGTVVEVSGTFDNSPQNLANPDPTATIRWGQQSWEEMFMGVLEVSE